MVIIFLFSLAAKKEEKNGNFLRVGMRLVGTTKV